MSIPFNEDGDVVFSPIGKGAQGDSVTIEIFRDTEDEFIIQCVQIDSVNGTRKVLWTSPNLIAQKGDVVELLVSPENTLSIIHDGHEVELDVRISPDDRNKLSNTPAGLFAKGIDSGSELFGLFEAGDNLTISMDGDKVKFSSNGKDYTFQSSDHSIGITRVVNTNTRVTDNLKVNVSQRSNNILRPEDDGLYVPHEDPNISSSDGTLHIGRIGGSTDIGVNVIPLGPSDKNSNLTTIKTVDGVTGIFTPRPSVVDSDSIRWDSPNPNASLSPKEAMEFEAEVKIAPLSDNIITQLPTGLYVSPDAASGSALPTDITSADFQVGGSGFLRTINLKPDMALDISTIKNKLDFVTHDNTLAGSGAYGDPISVVTRNLAISQGMGISITKDATGLTVSDRLSEDEGNALVHGADGGLYISADTAGAISHIESPSGTITVSQVGRNVDIAISNPVLQELNSKMSRVYHDATLTGTGTEYDPISVVGGSGTSGIQNIYSPQNTLRITDAEDSYHKNVDVRTSALSDNVLTLRSDGLYVPFAGSGAAGLPTDITSESLEVGGSGFSRSVELSETTQKQLESIKDKMTNVFHDNTLSGKGTPTDPLHADIEITNTDKALEVLRVADGNQINVKRAPVWDNILQKTDEGLYVKASDSGATTVAIDSPKGTLDHSVSVLEDGIIEHHLDVEDILTDKIYESITSVVTDGVTVIGDGTADSPLTAFGGGDAIVTYDVIVNDWRTARVIYENAEVEKVHKPQYDRIDYLPSEITLKEIDHNYDLFNDCVRLYYNGEWVDQNIGNIYTPGVGVDTNFNRLTFAHTASVSVNKEMTICSFKSDGNGVDTFDLFASVAVVNEGGAYNVYLYTTDSSTGNTSKHGIYELVNVNMPHLPAIPSYSFSGDRVYHPTYINQSADAKLLGAYIGLIFRTQPTEYKKMNDAVVDEKFTAIEFFDWGGILPDDQEVFMAKFVDNEGHDIDIRTFRRAKIQYGMPTDITSPDGSIKVGGDGYSRTVELSDMTNNRINSKLDRVVHSMNLIGKGTVDDPLDVSFPNLDGNFVATRSIAPQREMTIENKGGYFTIEALSVYGNKKLNINDNGFVIKTENTASNGYISLPTVETGLGTMTDVNIFSDHVVRIGGQDGYLRVDPTQLELTNLGTLTDPNANDIRLFMDDDGFHVKSGYDRIPLTLSSIDTGVYDNGEGFSRLWAKGNGNNETIISVDGDTSTIQSGVHRLQVKSGGLYWDDMRVDFTARGVPEAPLDGATYARNMGVWTALDIDALGGVRYITSSNLDILGDGNPTQINIPSQTMAKIVAVDSKISQVYHDATLDGLGTVDSPLTVLGGGSGTGGKVTSVGLAFTSATKNLHIDVTNSDSSVVSSDVVIPYPDSSGGGGIDDAPTDGKTYARKSATWTPLPEDFVEVLTSDGTITVSQIPTNPNGKEIDVKISRDSSNSLVVGSDGGLFVPTQSGGGGSSQPTDITSPTKSITVGGNNYNRTVDLEASLQTKINNSISAISSSDGSLSITGSGASKDATIKLAGGDNILSVTSEGLYAPPGGGSGGGLPTHVTSPQGTLVIGGVDYAVTADVRISADAGNALYAGADGGLYVATSSGGEGQPTNIIATDTSITVGGSGYSRTIAVNRSEKSDNQLSIEADGLYVAPQSGGDGKPTNVTALDNSIYVEGADYDKKIKVQVSAASTNALTLTAQGLYVAQQSAGGGISTISSTSLDIAGTGDTRTIELKTADKNAIAAVPSKLSTVAVDGTTIVGDGTASNPLQAIGGGGGTSTSQPTLITSNDFAVTGSGTYQTTINLKAADRQKIDTALATVETGTNITGTGTSLNPLDLQPNLEGIEQISIDRTEIDLSPNLGVTLINKSNTGSVSFRVAANLDRPMYRKEGSATFEGVALISDIPAAPDMSNYYTKAQVDAAIASAVSAALAGISSSDNTITVTNS